MRKLGHCMLDDMISHLQNIESNPCRFPPKEAISGICVPLTPEGEGEEALYNVVKDDVLPYTFPHTKPRFWGVVAGTGSVYGVLAEMV
jgi:hypothetical protein